MKKLRMLFLLGAMSLLGVTPLAAQNSVDVIGGTQPPNTVGAAVNPIVFLRRGPRPPTRGWTSPQRSRRTLYSTPMVGLRQRDFPAATTGQNLPCRYP